MTSTILVTGGAGFIGSHLVRLLVERGERMRVLDLPGAPVSHLPLDRLELVSGDICDEATVQRAVRGCREVYHLAANPHLWVQPRGQFRRVNYIGALNVIESALAAGVRRVLHASTESILTRARQSEAITEEQHVTYEDVIGPYCRSKYLAERHALRRGRAGAGRGSQSHAPRRTWRLRPHAADRDDARLLQRRAPRIRRCRAESD